MKLFFRHEYRTPLKPFGSPSFSLTTDNWDDFGTQCMFHLKYHLRVESFEIGSVKIIQKGEYLTNIPDEFDLLDDSFISLGQGVDFYEKLLKHCGKKMAIKVLESLRDIAWKPPLAESFEPTPQFRNALVRENTALAARRFGHSIIIGEPFDESFSFKYRVEIPGSDGPFDVNINLDEKDLVPGRIVSVIGRNAAGKTKFLTSLANDLVQLRETSVDAAEKRDIRFSGERPIFTRVIAVSYSAFDKFTRPSSQHSSYIYCGIRNEKGVLSRGYLLETYRNNLRRIRESNRNSDWISYMKTILGDGGDIISSQLNEEIENADVTDESLSLLSSGQSILAHFVTALVAWVEPNSLILFDEPEAHLHPNAVAGLIGVLNAILKNYRSFAIVATHSPLVIQEVPAKRVVVLQREGNATTSGSLPMESFGENISELTRHVFETIEIPHAYKNVLKRLSKGRTFEEVLELFDNHLSMNALSYLTTRYKDVE